MEYGYFIWKKFNVKPERKFQIKNKVIIEDFVVDQLPAFYRELYRNKVFTIKSTSCLIHHVNGYTHYYRFEEDNMLHEFPEYGLKWAHHEQNS